MGNGRKIIKRLMKINKKVESESRCYIVATRARVIHDSRRGGGCDTSPTHGLREPFIISITLLDAGLNITWPDTCSFMFPGKFLHFQRFCNAGMRSWSTF